MPDIHIRNVDQSLLREINIAAAKAELTQRDWLIKTMSEAVGIGKTDRVIGGYSPQLAETLKLPVQLEAKPAAKLCKHNYSACVICNFNVPKSYRIK